MISQIINKYSNIEMDFSLSTHYAINPLAETKLDESKDKRLKGH